MNILDRITSGFLLVNGILGLLTFTHIASDIRSLPPLLPFFILLSMLFLAALAIVAGAFSLKGKRWAIWLGLFFYLLQFAMYHSPSFSLGFQLGLAFNVVYQATEFAIVVNLVAIGLAVLCAISLRWGPTYHSSGTA